MKLKKLYKFYVDLLFYVYCPEPMQTVSLTEKILSEAAEINYLDLNANFTIYNLACDYISNLFGVLINKYRDETIIVQYHEGKSILSILKENANSKVVKSYFGL